MKLIERKNCPMQRKNGDCLAMGGFCLYVNDEICRGLHNAYNKGVKAEPVKHGQWINVKISISGNSSAECSLCGAVVHNDFSDVINYCPNCGARMDGTNKSVESVDLGNGFSITANGMDGGEND